MTPTARRLAATIDTEVVGRKHYPCEIAAGDVLRLCREPENRHDRNAIRVETQAGAKVGYLPRNCAYWFAEWLDGGAIETVALVHHHAPEDARFGLPVLVVVWAGANVELFGPRWSKAKGKPRTRVIYSVDPGESKPMADVIPFDFGRLSPDLCGLSRPDLSS